jgi:hypothetical protein
MTVLPDRACHYIPRVRVSSSRLASRLLCALPCFVLGLIGNSGRTLAEDASPVETATNFVNDVLPVLTKFGCNSGACHGKSTGQNGFKLSLYGFDPEADFAALAYESLGRRVDPAAPGRSLVLEKTTAQLAHGGGQRFDAQSQAYGVLRNWIAEGTPWGEVNAPRVERIEIAPPEIITSTGAVHPLKVVAYYSDGSDRDVTALALYDSQRPEFLRVSEVGELTLADDLRGEGAVMIRYQGLVGLARVVVPYTDAPPSAELAAFQPKNFIDELALAKWKKLGIAPSEDAGDAEFLRRAHLDAIGTLPTPDEIRAFLADESPDKRERLIDRLIERSEYGDLWALRWGDWLRNKQGDGDQQKEHSIAFTHWIRDAIQNNMPYDKFVRSIVAVTGKLKEHPELDWYRQVTSNQLRVEDTAQSFLGMRVACANCHNHPFESISQRDYWRFAAFFARVEAKTYGTVETVSVKKSGDIEHPRTGEKLTPKAFFGPEFEFADGEDPRIDLVDWMTAPDNPLLAKAVVNRYWGHFFGAGLIDPIDDMRATNPASNPELLEALARDFVEHGYDIKHLVRTIMTSRVYGLTTAPNGSNQLDTRNFARRYPERLSPYVLMDAISDATGVPEKIDYFDVKRAIQIPNERGRSEFLDLFGRTKRQTACECETRSDPSLAQILYFMNSRELHEKIANKDGVLSGLIADGKSTAEIVEGLYLRVLSRMPASDELNDAVALIDEPQDEMQRRELLEDFMWTLLNSREFLFNH